MSSIEGEAMRERLWICPRCKRIGSELDAKNHHTGTGHKIEELDQATSDGVLEIWREQRMQRVAALTRFGEIDWDV